MIVQRFGATQAAMSNYIVPIVATFGGVYWLDETVTSGVFLGMVAILAGIVLINVQKPQARHVGKKIETQLAS
ncbi:DMT family transporter [Chloroflexi bacterium TSY]|nr:DMT family transporter [Chloroflexi bacterium TSY]